MRRCVDRSPHVRGGRRRQRCNPAPIPSSVSTSSRSTTVCRPTPSRRARPAWRATWAAPSSPCTRTRSPVRDPHVGRRARSHSAGGRSWTRWSRTHASAPRRPVDTVPWGLDRVDQRHLPLDDAYGHGAPGTGVRVYLLDGSVDLALPEFQGRASLGVDMVTAPGVGDDCDHARDRRRRRGRRHDEWQRAGGLAGVGPRARLRGHRAPSSQLLAGLDWVTANAIRPRVATVSATSPASDALDAAVRRSITTGITYVAAAGNTDTDACDGSPAACARGRDRRRDRPCRRRATFSNFGSCVDLFAPGVAVRSVADPARTTSGTSLSAAYVAGAAAAAAPARARFHARSDSRAPSPSRPRPTSSPTLATAPRTGSCTPASSTMPRRTIRPCPPAPRPRHPRLVHDIAAASHLGPRRRRCSHRSRRARRDGGRRQGRERLRPGMGRGTVVAPAHPDRLVDVAGVRRRPHRDPERGLDRVRGLRLRAGSRQQLPRTGSGSTAHGGRAGSRWAATSPTTRSRRRTGPRPTCSPRSRRRALLAALHERLVGLAAGRWHRHVADRGGVLRLPGLPRARARRRPRAPLAADQRRRRRRAGPRWVAPPTSTPRVACDASGLSLFAPGQRHRALPATLRRRVARVAAPRRRAALGSRRGRCGRVDPGLRGLDSGPYVQQVSGTGRSGWSTMGGIVTAPLSATFDGSSVTVFARGRPAAVRQDLHEQLVGLELARRRAPGVTTRRGVVERDHQVTARAGNRSRIRRVRDAVHPRDGRMARVLAVHERRRLHRRNQPGVPQPRARYAGLGANGRCAGVAASSRSTSVSRHRASASAPRRSSPRPVRPRSRRVSTPRTTPPTAPAPRVSRRARPSISTWRDTTAPIRAAPVPCAASSPVGSSSSTTAASAPPCTAACAPASATSPPSTTTRRIPGWMRSGSPPGTASRTSSASLRRARCPTRCGPSTSASTSYEGGHNESWGGVTINIDRNAIDGPLFP